MSKLAELCEKLGITIKSVRIEPTEQDDKLWKNASHWKCKLSFEGRTITTQFHMGSAHKDKPKVNQVLYSLVSDASSGQDTFEDFCANYGGDTDSIKTRKSWLECKKMAQKLPIFLGNSHEEVREAAQEE